MPINHPPAQGPEFPPAATRMRICLDTNAYSRLMRNREMLTACLERAESIFIPTIVLGELHAGFEMGAQRNRNREELARFLDVPGVYAAEVTADVSERYGLLVKDLRAKGTPIPTNDIWIAAISLELGTRLVTYDDHFAVIPGLIVVAP